MALCIDPAASIVAGSGIVISGSGTPGDPWLISTTSPVDILELEEDIANILATLATLGTTYVNVTGDTMTGMLTVNSSTASLRARRPSTERPFIEFYSSDGIDRLGYIVGANTGMELVSDPAGGSTIKFMPGGGVIVTMTSTSTYMGKTAGSIATEGIELHQDAGAIWATRIGTNGPNFISNKSGATSNIDGAVHMEIMSAGTQIGRIHRVSSTTSAYTGTSDHDLKENITPVDDDLALLWMRLVEPVFFNFKADPDIIQVGYIAQDTAEMWPNSIGNGVVSPGCGDVENRTWDDKGNETTPRDKWQPWMMDYGRNAPLVHSALQALDRVVESRTAVLDDHEARLDALESLVTAQAAEITSLKARVTALEGKHEHMLVDAPWIYSSAAPPATKDQVRYNTTTGPTATSISIRRLDFDAVDRSTWLQAIKAESTVRVSDLANAAVYDQFRATGPATLDATNATIPVIWVHGTGPINNGKNVTVTFFVEIPASAQQLTEESDE